MLRGAAAADDRAQAPVREALVQGVGQHEEGAKTAQAATLDSTEDRGSAPEARGAVVVGPLRCVVPGTAAGGGGSGAGFGWGGSEGSALGSAGSPAFVGAGGDALGPAAPEATYPAAEVDSGTDTDAASSLMEAQQDFTDIQHLPEDEQAAHLFWAYEHAKARWRRFNHHNPTRRVRSDA